MRLCAATVCRLMAVRLLFRDYHLLAEFYQSGRTMTPRLNNMFLVLTYSIFLTVTGSNSQCTWLKLQGTWEICAEKWDGRVRWWIWLSMKYLRPERGLAALLTGFIISLGATWVVLSLCSVNDSGVQVLILSSWHAHSGSWRSGKTKFKHRWACQDSNNNIDRVAGAPSNALSVDYIFRLCISGRDSIHSMSVRISLEGLRSHRKIIDQCDLLWSCKCSSASDHQLNLSLSGITSSSFSHPMRYFYAWMPYHPCDCI